MARVLVLRAEAEAATTAAALAARGHVPLLLPLQEIRTLHGSPPEGRFAGLLVTSANAVPALKDHPGLKALPVLAVGERTASALRAAGFGDVTTGEGDGAALADVAQPLAERSGLPLLYAAGRVRTAGLETRLLALGVPFRVFEAYDTKPLHPGLKQIATVLAGKAPDVVLLLSVGQAEGYAELARRLPECFLPAPSLVCLSARIAAALPMELRSRAKISATSSLAALFERDL